jgi:hypothetical protein
VARAGNRTQDLFEFRLHICSSLSHSLREHVENKTNPEPVFITWVTTSTLYNTTNMYVSLHFGHFNDHMITITFPGTACIGVGKSGEKKCTRSVVLSALSHALWYVPTYLRQDATHLAAYVSFLSICIKAIKDRSVAFSLVVKSPTGKESYF